MENKQTFQESPYLLNVVTLFLQSHTLIHNLHMSIKKVYIFLPEYLSEKTTTKWCNGKKEGNVLFNDALHTFYLWLYGIEHMIKDH